MQQFFKKIQNTKETSNKVKIRPVIYVRNKTIGGDDGLGKQLMARLGKSDSS